MFQEDTNYTNFHELIFAGLEFAWIGEIRVCLVSYSCGSASIRGSNPVARLTGQRLADGGEDFFVRREKDEALPGDDLVADQHGELAEAAFNQSGLHSEFAFQQGRHTDGPRFIRRSGLAVADGEGDHLVDVPSAFVTRIAKPTSNAAHAENNIRSTAQTGRSSQIASPVGQSNCRS